VLAYPEYYGVGCQEAVSMPFFYASGMALDREVSTVQE